MKQQVFHTIQIFIRNVIAENRPGFQRLLSHIDDDDGENNEKSAEKIFKKMTKVKKIRGTGHKKSIAAIAKLRKQKQSTRTRRQVKKWCCCHGYLSRVVIS